MKTQNLAGVDSVDLDFEKETDDCANTNQV